jgi:hypothetical protein
VSRGGEKSATLEKVERARCAAPTGLEEWGKGTWGIAPVWMEKLWLSPVGGEPRCTVPVGTELGLGNPVFHKFSGDVG